MKTCLSSRILSFAVIISVMLAFCACSGTKAPAQVEVADTGVQSNQSTQASMNKNTMGIPKASETSESAQGDEASGEKKGTAVKTDSTAVNNSGTLEKSAAEKTDADANESHGTTEPQKPSNGEELTVHLSIVYPKEANLPDASASFAFREGESVLDILVRYGRENKIPVAFSGMKSNGYVEGINGVFEFDYGAESGWVYEVNGIMPKTSAGAYKPKNKDTIKWRYIYSLSGVTK